MSPGAVSDNPEQHANTFLMFASRWSFALHDRERCRENCVNSLITGSRKRNRHTMSAGSSCSSSSVLSALFVFVLLSFELNLKTGQNLMSYWCVSVWVCVHVLSCIPVGSGFGALTDNLITEREKQVIEKAAGCVSEWETRPGGRLLSHHHRLSLSLCLRGSVNRASGWNKCRFAIAAITQVHASTLSRYGDCICVFVCLFRWICSLVSFLIQATPTVTSSQRHTLGVRISRHLMIRLQCRGLRLWCSLILSYCATAYR